MLEGTRQRRTLTTAGGRTTLILVHDGRRMLTMLEDTSFNSRERWQQRKSTTFLKMQGKHKTRGVASAWSQRKGHSGRVGVGGDTWHALVRWECFFLKKVNQRNLVGWRSGTRNKGAYGSCYHMSSYEVFKNNKKICKWNPTFHLQMFSTMWAVGSSMIQQSIDSYEDSIVVDGRVGQRVERRLASCLTKQGISFPFNPRVK